MILGHNQQKEYFNKILQKNRLAHAYLFYGPEAVGKFLFAKTIAKFLHCQKNLESLEKVCGSCISCRQIEEGAHLEVIVLDREHTLLSKKEERSDIPIDDIREIKRRFSLASPEGKWRVVIINDAHTLSIPAANSFLRLLEEPGTNSVFFLVTSEKELLLSTIVSRAIPVRFSLLPESVLARHLQPLVRDENLREEVLRLSFGKPGNMLRYIGKKELLEKELKLRKAVEAALKSGSPEIFLFTQNLASDEKARKSAGEYLLHLLRASLFSKARQGDVQAILQGIKKVSYALSLMDSTNVNPRLALDIALIEAGNSIKIQ